MVPFFTSVAADHEIFVRAPANAVNWQIYCSCQGSLGPRLRPRGCLRALVLRVCLVGFWGWCNALLIALNGLFWCLTRSTLIPWSYRIFVISTALRVRLVASCLGRGLFCQRGGLVGCCFLLLVLLAWVLHPCQLVFCKFYVKLISIKEFD